MKIGLILVGGSARGVAVHHAVVMAMRNLDLKANVVLGASAGSIVASFYCTDMSSDIMKWHLSSLTSKEFLDPISKWGIFKELIINHGRKLYGFVKGEQLKKYVAIRIEGKDDFSKTTIPLYISVTNLKTYKLTLMNTGSISEKVRASCAIPMMFCPAKIDNQYYIDGAIQKDKLPKALLSVHPDLDYVIVSNASYDDETDDNSYVEGSKLPLVEIVRRAMSMHEKFVWPKKIGKTKFIYLIPGYTTPLDIFNVDSAVMNSVYQDTLRYATFHLQRYFKRVLKDQQRRAKKLVAEQKPPAAPESPTQL